MDIFLDLTNKKNMRKYKFGAYEELWDIMQDWRGTDVYSEIIETFFAADYDINEPMFWYAIYQYDMMEDLEDWFIDNGGDIRGYKSEYNY
tara:strand:+ start:6 stop:275 length:270 start_codon:yes stop_codon:yes gene_type:complete